jgi:CheY-like chemotaxis protein
MPDRDNRTILLVDGSVSASASLSLLLNRLDYRATPARSAESALRMLETSNPLVILSELALPDMSGEEFLKRVKAEPRFKAIPFVILATMNDRGRQNACERSGCAAYLVKPVEPDFLYRTIQTVSELSPRRHIRLKTTIDVVVGDNSVAGGSRRIEHATAISEGGLFVKTRYPQPRSAATPVRLTVNGFTVAARAEVLYTYAPSDDPSLEPGMGMKFLDISDDSRRAIREFIRQQLSNSTAGSGGADTAFTMNAVCMTACDTATADRR